MRHLALVTGCALLGAVLACGGGRGHRAPARAQRDVQAYLAPEGKDGVRFELERRAKELQMAKTVVSDRRMLAARTPEGALLRFTERIDGTRWRDVAQLRIVAEPTGAYITEQYGLSRRRLGVDGKRLLFPWPVRAGAKVPVSYKILDGRKATGHVTVDREGFEVNVGGTRYRPCIEVTERLDFGPKDFIQLRQVFCRGLGRAEIESHIRTPRGEELWLDRTLAPSSGSKE